MLGVLVVDTGQDIVGIYSVNDSRYRPYRGQEMLEALQQIEQADELVTYNGERYDLARLSEIASGVGRTFTVRCKHSDMQRVCWGNILGSSLSSTYAQRVGVCPAFPDTYEGSNERDVYMTYALWSLWQHGLLKESHGYVYPANTA